MKKFFQTVMAVALGVFALSSCSDVPAPYDIPGMNDDDDPAVVIEPAGSGTAADPFNVAAAVAKCQEIGATESTDKYYVKGVIKKITLAFDESSVNSYGNATFDMVDDLKATTSFKAFQVYYLEGKKCFVPNTIAVGDTVVVYGPIYNYGGNTPETAGKGAAYICQHNGAGNVTPDVPAGDPKGTGTLADPFNAVAANAYISALAADTESASDIYIKGKVTEIKEAFSSYGNTTFYLADEEGGQTFYVFRALGLGNQKCTDANAYKVGDEVVVCGKVVNYKGNTPETVQNKAYIYSINGKTDSGTDPVTPGDVKGDGSAADPFNIAAAIAKCQETGETATTDVYYVKGIVSRLSSSYANTFWISEDGNAANEVEFYNGVGIDGATLQTGDVGVGDEVVVRGKLVNYKGNTPELEKGCEIVSIKKNANPTPDVEVTELVNGDFESWNGSIPTGWKSASTASNATLSQSTDAHGGNYAVLVGCTASANKRLATQEIKLAAGTYTFSFYAKSTVSDKSQCRPGYVPVTDGSVGTYMYGDYASIKSTEWTLVSYEFTLTEETTVCLVVMNPKASSYADSQDILVDDATLVKK